MLPCLPSYFSINCLKAVSHCNSIMCLRTFLDLILWKHELYSHYAILPKRLLQMNSMIRNSPEVALWSLQVCLHSCNISISSLGRDILLHATFCPIFPIHRLLSVQTTKRHSLGCCIFSTSKPLLSLLYCHCWIIFQYYWLQCCSEAALFSFTK